MIYQKKAFGEFYNIGVTFAYRKMQSKGPKVIKTHFYPSHVAAILFFSVICVIHIRLCDIPKDSILRALQDWSNICI